MTQTLQPLRPTPAPPPTNPSASAPVAKPNDHHWTRAEYHQLKQRIRVIVTKHVPARATVAVVAKGDDEMLAFDGVRRGWHFPRRANGAYAGHHLADGAEAIKHLRTQAEWGATHLLVPATSFWWLDFYAELGAHVAQHCRAVHRDDACAIFELPRPSKKPTKPSGEPDPIVADDPRYAALIRQIREVVRHTLPRDAVVAVVSRGDYQLLVLGDARRGSHVPRGSNGVYLGHHPADGREALAQVRRARREGSRYLLIPATSSWWLQHYRELQTHLERRARLVVSQRHVCLVYDLSDDHNGNGNGGGHVNGNGRSGRG